MKVTLDLDRLLQDGDITESEYERLNQLAGQATGSLAFNILIGFGVIAVSGSLLALVPNVFMLLILGLGILAGGLALLHRQLAQWVVLANICILVGALMTGGAIMVIGGGSAASILVVTVLLAVAGIFAQSALLVVLATLTLAACTGVQTGYTHATYGLGVPEPTLTILLFGVLAWGLHYLSGILAVTHQRLAVAGARTSLFLVNFGFWVGSLFGDEFRRAGYVYGTEIGAGVFSVLWAVGLVATAVWAWRQNRRWVLNLTAVFGGIHLYTQWFEYLSVNPVSVLAAGLVALAAALSLRTLNGRMKASED